MGCEVELTPMSNGRTVQDQGSKERSLDKMKMREHFLTCHTDEELYQWGFNRRQLKIDAGFKLKKDTLLMISRLEKAV